MKSFPVIILFVSLFFFSSNAFSQLKVKTDGTVKIGSASAFPDGGDLQIVQENKTTEARVFAASPNISRIWALNSVYCYAFGVDETGKGQIWGNINTNTKLMTFNSYGSFGINSTPGTAFKLYIGGSAYCTGIWQTSDKTLKRDIQPISNPIETLKNIEGRKYFFINEDTMKSSFQNRLHYGFIAQDVQKVLPDLVMEVDDSSKTLAINYDGFIPILVEGLKAQQEMIENLESEIALLKMSNGLFNGNPEETNNKLFQNNPNPFNQNTEIKYFVDKKATTAMINIYNLQGTQIKSFNLSERGSGVLTIEGSELEPGLFLYCLVVDGKIIDTKQMVITD